MYYLKKGNEDAARASLVRLRGPRYNVEPEIQAQQEIIAQAERNSVSFGEAMRTRAAKRGLIIGFGLMFFQQLSGVNAFIFYAGAIFKTASDTIDPYMATIIVGIIQVVAVFLSTLIVDALGRRILLLVSEIAMFVTTLVIGIYFYLKETGHDVSNIGWLPLVCVCGFIFLFSLGFGPIPWMMMGEIFSPTIKGKKHFFFFFFSCYLNYLIIFFLPFFFNRRRG